MTDCSDIFIACHYVSLYITYMSQLENFLQYSLQVFKVAIILRIGDKVVFVSPSILKTISYDRLAEALLNSDLTDEEVIQGLEIIDNADTVKVPPSDKTPEGESRSPQNNNRGD